MVYAIPFAVHNLCLRLDCDRSGTTAVDCLRAHEDIAGGLTRGCFAGGPIAGGICCSLHIDWFSCFFPDGTGCTKGADWMTERKYKLSGKDAEEKEPVTGGLEHA